MSAGTVLSLKSGGTWPVSNTDPNGHLIAISCPSTRFCLTVHAEGFAIPQIRGTWGAPAPGRLRIRDADQRVLC